MGGAFAIPYSDTPSQDALDGTVVKVGEGFGVRVQIFQLHEVEPLSVRPYDCLGVEGPVEVAGGVDTKELEVKREN